MGIFKSLARLSSDEYITEASYVEQLKEQLRLFVLIDKMTYCETIPCEKRVDMLSNLSIAIEDRNKNKLFKAKQQEYEDIQNKKYEAKEAKGYYNPSPQINIECRSTQHRNRIHRNTTGM